jgi:hypothetical protein
MPGNPPLGIAAADEDKAAVDILAVDMVVPDSLELETVVVHRSEAGMGCYKPVGEFDSLIATSRLRAFSLLGSL